MLHYYPKVLYMWKKKLKRATESLLYRPRNIWYYCKKKIKDELLHIVYAVYADIICNCAFMVKKEQCKQWFVILVQSFIKKSIYIKVEYSTIASVIRIVIGAEKLGIYNKSALHLYNNHITEYKKNIAEHWSIPNIYM